MEDESKKAEQQFRLKKLVKQLEAMRGRHTELVSVYIPAGASLNDINNILANEISLTQNVKSKAVRNNVIDALTKIVQHLKLYRKTPEHGLAIFAGNVSENEGKTDIKLWAVEPPEPVTVKLYWCDQKFELEHLKQQLKEKEVYGLAVLDTKEATIGMLKGKSVQVIRHLESIVPGKFIKGGQCLSPDTLIQTTDGNITKIKDLKEGETIISVNTEKPFNIKKSKIIDLWSKKDSKIYKIVTRYPRLEIESSRHHMFFVWDNGNIKEVPAEELKEKDFLLTLDNITTEGANQQMDSNINAEGREWLYNKVILPSQLDCKTAQIAGYFIGDGNYDKNRICFSESDKELAIIYKNLLKNIFNIDAFIKFREKKNYYEIRVCSKTINEFFKKNFIKEKNSLNMLIPSSILKSHNTVVASFLKGLFDAEGYVSSKLAIGMNNKHILQQVQLLLLRFGVMSSILDYDNRRNKYSKNHRYTLEVSEKKSLEIFKKKIGFSLERKVRKFEKLIKNKSEKSNVRKIVISGTEIRNHAYENGMKPVDFPKVTNFFRNERLMSKNVFENSILSKIKSDSLKSELKDILDYPLIPVKISKIDIMNIEKEIFDIAVENENFIANGILVHNSAARFTRVREGLINDWYKEVGEAMKSAFPQEIKGIILGGSGMSKEDFLKGDFIGTDLKNKILGTVDVGYTSEQGLHEMIERSGDILKEASISREREIVNKFLTGLQKDTGLSVYGIRSIIKALESGAVEMILISEGFEWKEFELICPSGHSEKRFGKDDSEFVCPVCGQKMQAVGEQDGVDAVEQMAEKFNTKVEIISQDTREGEQLFQLGGIGAILRWRAQ